MVAVQESLRDFHVTSFELNFKDYRELTQSPKRCMDSEEEISQKRRKVDDSDEDSESAAALTSLHSCTWSWDSDVDILDTLSLDNCDLSDSLSVGHRDDSDKEDVVEVDRSVTSTESKTVGWLTSNNMLQHLMEHEKDSDVLTEMLRDTFGHHIRALSQYCPAYNVRMGFIDLIEPGCQYAVLRLSCRIVGVAVIHPQFAGLPGFSVLSNFMIDRGFRGQGLGTYFIDAVHQQLVASGAKAIAMLQPATHAASAQMDSEAKRRQSWLTLQGYSAVAWDSVHPLAACARLQMLMDGLNPEDHAFLVRVGARQCLEATWQPYIAEGTILRQYSALKQMVGSGMYREMEKILKARECRREQQNRQRDLIMSDVSPSEDPEVGLDW
jgi:GNAT superfamily N-acetyltransferase|uniref:N-acetyltransferase domain-containing protein n=1 Tax=Eutreptiella gymnastica TaxID=73025 RepID=A0A7S4FVR2_9EUGL